MSGDAQLGAILALAYAALFGWIIYAAVSNRAARKRLHEEFRQRPFATAAGILLALGMLLGLLALIVAALRR